MNSNTRPAVHLDDATFDKVHFAARMLGVSEGEVVARLVASDNQVLTPSSVSVAADEIAVHAVYKGQLIEAVFESATNVVRIKTGHWAGKKYSSPSAAAIAVVEQLNPGREHANTNGRTFWIVDSTGKTLRSVLGRRGGWK